MNLSIRIFLATLFIMMIPAASHAAVIYIDPETGTYGPGDTFIASVRLDNDDECINAAEVEIRYPTDRLRAVDFSRGGSIFSLWVQEPKIDLQKGSVTFAGGLPGGYCGRIQGDPALSNVLGKVVFSVIRTEAQAADITVAPSTHVYLNDGLGTQAQLTVRGSTITLSPTSVSSENPWIREVGEDSIPPDAFTVQVESTRDVFGGRYYLVFSTLDKQSGIDHFELYERGAWKRITSPYKLYDQSLKDIRVKAIDKAGNERMGEYIEGSAPPSQAPRYDLVTILVLFAILVMLGSIKVYIDKRKKTEVESPLDLR